MREKTSQLEQIFDKLCSKYGLAVYPDGRGKIAHGQIYLLTLEDHENWVRLLYEDRVATADIYDCEDQKYLNYSMLSTYQRCQHSFLHNHKFSIAKNLLEDLTKKIQTSRQVSRTELDDFSEVEEFLSAHIENY